MNHLNPIKQFIFILLNKRTLIENEILINNYIEDEIIGPPTRKK